MLAWNRFAWFAPFQTHTFLPLYNGTSMVEVGIPKGRMIGTPMLLAEDCNALGVRN